MRPFRAPGKPPRKERGMISKVRTSMITVVVAAVTAALTAWITGSGPAGAFHTDHKAYYRRIVGAIGPSARGIPFEVQCPEGTRVLSGGFHAERRVHTRASYPSQFDTSTGELNAGFRYWTVVLDNHTGEQAQITVYAICADVGKDANYQAGAQP
jgi:hypothetical protein